MKEDIKDRVAKINRGEVPEGYKKTDFGIFPCDWETDKTLGDLFSFTGGLGKSREELSEKGIPYLHYGDMHRDDANVVSFEKYSRLPKWEGVISGEEGYLMDDGDVAFLDASEDLEGTSRAVLIENPDDLPFIAGLHIILGKPTGNELHKSFRQYISRPEYARKQFQKLASGFKVYGINRNTITKIKLAYPKSINEQNRIAGILHKWDEAIELYGRELSCLERFREVCLKKMFPIGSENVPEWRFSEFSIPWKQHRISDLGDIVTGSTPSTLHQEYYSPNGIPWVTPTDIVDKLTYQTPRKLSVLGESVSRIVPAGSVLVTCIASIGKNTILAVPGGFNQQINCVIPNKEENDSYFLLTESFHWSKKMKNQASVGTMQIVNKNEFSCMRTFAPELSEQKRIGEFFFQLDCLIETNKKKIRSAEKQKRILQHYLLSGLIRV